MEKPKAICHLTFSKLGGIKTAQMVLSAELKGIQSSRYEMSLRSLPIAITVTLNHQGR